MNSGFYHEFENFLKQTIPESREAVGDCFMTWGCQDTGGMVIMSGASRGLAIGADWGGVVDMEVSICGALVEVGCNIDELVADVETCGKEDHCCEECDCVHSCIFFNC